MKRPHSAKNALIVWVIILLALVAVYTLATIYLLRENHAAVAASNDTDFLIQRELKVRSLGSTIEALAQEGERLETYFIDPGNMIEFLEGIESLGDTLGVEVKVVSLGERELEEANGGKTSKDLGIVFLSLDVRGEWSRVFHYISSIESLPFAVEVIGVGLAQTENEGASIWSLLLDISVIKLINS